MTKGTLTFSIADRTSTNSGESSSLSSSSSCPITSSSNLWSTRAVTKSWYVLCLFSADLIAPMSSSNYKKISYISDVFRMALPPKLQDAQDMACKEDGSLVHQNWNLQRYCQPQDPLPWYHCWRHYWLLLLDVMSSKWYIQRKTSMYLTMKTIHFHCLPYSLRLLLKSLPTSSRKLIRSPSTNLSGQQWAVVKLKSEMILYPISSPWLYSALQ